MYNLLQTLSLFISIPIICYGLAWAIGAGWKRGRGELPYPIYINKADMEVNNPKIAPKPAPHIKKEDSKTREDSNE